MSSRDRGIFQDEKAATVVFGTLMIILVTITVVSALALTISVSQKDAMDRKSALEAAENENLKIVSIKPTPPTASSADPSSWDSLNITVLNLDILDAKVRAVSINGMYMANYFLIDENRKLDLIKDTEYPVTYNNSHRAEIPAGKARQLYVPLGGIHTSDTITIETLPDTVNLGNFPSKVYPGASPWVSVRNSTYYYYSPGSDFTVHASNFTLTVPSGSSMNAGSYTVEYTTYPYGNGQIDVLKGEPITVEIISDRINVYQKMFAPPVPLAEVQFKNDEGGDYLLLDASSSYDPDSDGFIKSYKWEVTDISTGITKTLKGIKAELLDFDLNSNCTIDLEITDDTGMVSRLSETSGNITIP